jgi:pimeloyl-ACP methyl ester carboxylesterase
MIDTLRRILATVTCLLQLFPFFAQHSPPDSLLIASLYEKRKKEFRLFEKQHGHYIQTKNVKMHYLTWGRPGPRAIIWSHGTRSNAYEMADLGDSLAASGYYVVAIDYYGHGYTPIPSHEVSLYHVADDIHELMKQLNIRKAVLGGWSRGGSVATAYYDSYPNEVSGLVLEDGGSVAWSADDHKKPVDSLEKQISVNYDKGAAEQSFSSELECFYHECRPYMNDKDFPTNRSRFFGFFAQAKQTPEGKWMVAPGLAQFICVKTKEQMLALKQRTLGADNLFCISNEQLNPMVIYRNLQVPVLIFDPVYPHDDLDFEEENRKLQQLHPRLVTHRVYLDTRHDVKLHKPVEFLEDTRSFLKKVYPETEKSSAKSK